MAAVEKAWMAVATMGGVGNSPQAPGTMGTLATLPFCWLLMESGLYLHIAAVVLVTVIGIRAANVAEGVLGGKDPSCVVVDEAAGMLLTMLGAPHGWIWLCGGFVLFRFFDIFKPWPVGWLDDNLSGGVGIMMDDLAAGVYAALFLQLFSWFVG